MSIFKKCSQVLHGLVFLGALYYLPTSAAKDPENTIDVVHFWISKSESAALDVLRQSWQESGGTWIDTPAKDKVSVQQIIGERVSNGYPPAVMQWNANEGAGELPQMGIVLDIDAVAERENWRQVLPKSVYNRISHQGKVYFAPTNIHAENWLWVSTSMFKQLGLHTPKTWEDVFASAQAIKDAGHVAIAIGGGKWEASLLFNNLMYYQMGADGYSRIIRGDAEAVLEPSIIKALEMFRRLSSYAEPLEKRRDKTWDDATDAVGSGVAGMQFMGDWAKGELYTNGYQIDKDFDCVLAPGTGIAYFMVIDAFAFPLSNREGQMEAQQKFAQMVLEPENQVAFSRLKGSLPVRMDVDPIGLDRCGRIGLNRLIEQNQGVTAQSMAMPSQMSEGWIGVLYDFFNDTDISAEEAQQRLYRILKTR